MILNAGLELIMEKCTFIKTGIIKQGKEASSYKNLIWIGRPANIASRLTDIANKELSETIFRVTRKLKNPRAYPS